MARAAVGARRPLASFALVSRETLAVTALTVANASASALSIVVAIAVRVGVINPTQLKRADAVTAVTTVVTETHAPIVVAIAYTIQLTGAMAAASIITTSLRGRQKRNQKT